MGYLAGGLVLWWIGGAEPAPTLGGFEADGILAKWLMVAYLGDGPAKRLVQGQVSNP